MRVMFISKGSTGGDCLRLGSVTPLAYTVLSNLIGDICFSTQQRAKERGGGEDRVGGHGREVDKEGGRGDGG